jgi:succinate dehydrogenase / fumarate reductase flavoprotein subunit
VGMARNAEGLETAREEIRDLKEDFWNNVKIPGELNDLNP